MRIHIAQSMWCNYRVISLPVDYLLDIRPIPGFPKGDEAAQIAETWRSARRRLATGLLLLGCDVAADPDDLAAMTAAVELAPMDLWTGMVKLWPQSTGRDTWMWSHRGGTLGAPVVLDDPLAPIAYVSLGFLWVPRRLLDAAAPIMGSWQHGQADVKLSEVALDRGILAHAVPDCRPKHLHFQEEHNGDYIRRQALRTPAPLRPRPHPAAPVAHHAAGQGRGLPPPGRRAAQRARAAGRPDLRRRRRPVQPGPDGSVRRVPGSN